MDTPFKFKNVSLDDLMINVTFEDITESLNVEFDEIHKVYVGGVPYDGDYIVTPKVNQQTLPTLNKLMKDDVTIKAIPYYDVGNTSGGSTVYIGNEV